MRLGESAADDDSSSLAQRLTIHILWMRLGESAADDDSSSLAQRLTIHILWMRLGESATDDDISFFLTLGCDNSLGEA
jgi:hypothetical protein